jgi:hypothetical protein
VTDHPGAWLPFPTSFEPRPDQDQELVEGEEEADREYIKRIRSIHSFGDAEDLSRAPEDLFQPSKQREPPIDDLLVQQLIATHETDVLLNEYRQMSASFPFVIIPEGMTSQEMHAEKPMLFLAILTAASWRDHPRQMSLDTLFRKELAQRTIITPRRTLGLVQSLLVYLSWYVTILLGKSGSSW